MLRPVLCAVVGLVVLAGCGGGSDPEPTAPTPSGSAAVPLDQQGTPAPQALSGLSCAATDAGTWTASGVVSNATDAAVTYRVTAYVGPADGQARAAVDTTLDRVQPDGSAGFELTGIPPHGDAPTCHVQVLTVD